MRQIEQQHYDVIVIGGGQAGLAISYLLKQDNINHIVLERNQIANSWVNQRWDSFTLNTPNWMNLLPGMTLSENEDREAFKTNAQYIDTLIRYVHENDLPVVEHCEVTAVHHHNDLFDLTVIYQGIFKKLSANQVVVASGKMSDFENPLFANPLASKIKQINVGEYKNPSQVSGNVLIVGSGQSGVQIAEELAQSMYPNKDKIYLATSEVARSPRRYRGKDMMEWLTIIGAMDQRTDELEDINMSLQTQPQVSGVGQYGHTVSLQSLHELGVIHVGKLLTATKDSFEFNDKLKQHIVYADKSSEKLKALVDGYLNKTGELSLYPNVDIDKADHNDPTFVCASDLTTLDFDQVDTVIWAIGYKAKFNYLHIPGVLNEKGQPIQTNGISVQKGLYYLGFPWMIKRKSGIIFGVAEDAQAIKDEMRVK
ncbi:NAD(P)-binding domain-containing protein [Myroides marinus]|uniref:NAD(P)-binding domain-containing protein n=1 Tax=Myroides marinus TaxID=703342 RepID=UPI00257654DD|nr:NAD(P)-binding domain-containing protein [Myroides marinus]MDM1352388.1 NAD(P)-binding domain-containing protein [Myroides marinus]MDM1359593.1 NAD(P)-binding domain-containing protein [Myroides marinus]MDM1366735.1 NAD(P)-binding domain-containing protein [Myroides marinus]MDM1380825.1 NAD(P)-binding domain-containing protein [Myroides marinus]MDM1388097.1 NAD(P)-binding domain-containing protein [Myroides marinus]